MTGFCMYMYMYLYLLFCKERIRAHWFVNRAPNKCCVNKYKTSINPINKGGMLNPHHILGD